MSHSVARGVVSTDNSTAVPLGGGATFTGVTEEVKDFALLTTIMHAEPSTASGTLYLEFSTDGVNFDRPLSFPVTDPSDPAQSPPHSLIPTAQYFRVRYVNDGVAQTVLRLQTIFHTHKSKGLTSRLNQTLTGTTDVDNVRSVIVGQHPDGDYHNVPLTFDGALSVGFGDGVNLDAFSRLRVSNPFILFDSKTIRGRKEDLLWTEALTAGGTSTHNANKSATMLTVTGIGDKVVRQTRARLIYQPGRSMLHYLTCVPPTFDSNVRWRKGFFDDNDGIFLEGVGSTIKWVIRSSTSGAPVDTAITQANWNADRFDPALGKNPSGITMDFDAMNLLAWMDLQWLSIGRVRVGFDLEGSVLTAHEFNHSNLTDRAYMTHPNLPIRFEIEATGVPGAARTLESICAATFSEGGFDPVGLSTSVSTGRSGNGVTDTYEEIIAVRVKDADKNRVLMHIQGLSLMASSSGNIHYLILLNPTGLGAGAWVSAGSESSLEYNITRGTGWVRGSEDHVMNEGFFSANVDSTNPQVNGRVRPGVKLDGTQDVISLMACNASGTATETLFGGLSLLELF